MEKSIIFKTCLSVIFIIMSSKTKLGKSAKSGGAKSVGPNVPDPLPPVSPVPVGTNPATIIFPEWSDQDVNTEKWDLPKSKDKAKTSPKKGSPVTPGQVPAENNLDEPSEFVDPHLVRLPHSLPLHEWKRPSQVFVNANFIMYKESSEYPDLVSGSKHLLHSDFMRSFISAIGILEYLGNTRPTPIEFASPTFVPNTSDIPWRPWHHIYSMCKAGKGQKHNPQVNQLGKYVVRLFWMGCWRKIVVDDQLPVDPTKHVLFPTLHVPSPPSASSPSKASLESSKAKGGSKKGSEPKATNDPKTNEIEMWPLILCKALLKLSNLTITEFNEMLDFDIIHCLTGIDLSDIWEMCAGYSDHYTWPDSTKNQVTGSKSKDSKGSKASKGSKGSKSGKSVSNFLDDGNSRIAPFHLIATCSDMRTLAEDHVPDISPCWSHSFLIDQTRNVPLIKPDPLPELARWKRFRWLAWAIREGLWPTPELIPIKCFKMVSVFKKCSEHIIYTLPSKEALDIKKSVAVIEKLALEMGDGKKKDKGADSKKDKASASSSKGSKDTKGTKGPVIVPIPPDPSLWIDFNKLGPYISTLYIFLKSSQFQTNIKITDIAQTSSDGKAKADKGKKGKGTPGKGEPTSQVLVWSNRISSFRNEPIYLFMDSIDYKLIVLNLAQIGNTNALLEVNDKSEHPTDLEPQRQISEEIRGMDKSEYLFFADEFIQESFSPHESEYINPPVPYAYIIMEDYDWQSLKTGNTTSFLNTYGTKTILIDIAPGRFILRLWIKSDTSYTVNIMSDSPMVAGTLEAILENMCQESERLMKLCHDISSSYGQLVQKFGTPQFAEGLVTFCKSYLPNSKLSKLEVWKVHNSFIKELLNTVKDICPAQEFRDRIFALKVLFMNPAIKYDNLESCRSKEMISSNLSAESRSDDISQTSDDFQQLKRTERAAVTLQAYFKKLYVRKLRSLHKESHKDYLKIFDLLKRNYTNCFGIQVRMQVCLALIRNFIFAKSAISHIIEQFPLLKDLNSTIHLQHFTGEIFAPATTWVPITRKVFYSNSPYAVAVKICLFCGFCKYMVRIFDNDTDEEIKRFTNNAAVHAYRGNIAGYTVLCYGWSESEDKLYPWKLDFITTKIKPVSLIIVPEVTTFNYILQQNYRPNVYNTICRCLVNINHDVLVTFRLSTSYEGVKFYFRCVNEVGQVFGEIYGIAGAILPKIMLKYVATIDDSTQYADGSQKSILSKDRRLSKSKSRSVSLTRTNSKLKRKSKSSDKSSADRTSLTESASSQKKSKTSITSQDVKYRDTVYLIEGFVIDDSWPLTKNEWDVVEEIKVKSLLGPIIIPNFDRENSVGSSTKFRDKISSRQSLGSKRKSSDIRRKSSEVSVTDQPFWRLETISNSEDSLVATLDKRREFEIRSIKTGWYENDPERYRISKQLRQDYLEAHYIKPEVASEHSNSIRMYSLTSQASDQCNGDSTVQRTTSRMFSSRVFNSSISSTSRQISAHTSLSIENSGDTVRTLEKPVLITEMLPPLKLEDHVLIDKAEVAAVKSEEETEKFVKTPEHEEEMKLLRAQELEDFELYQMNFEDDMIKYISTHAGQNKLLDLFYRDCRTASHEMITNAFKLREQVIDTIIDEYIAKQPPPTAKAAPAKGKKK